MKQPTITTEELLKHYHKSEYIDTLISELTKNGTSLGGLLNEYIQRND